MNKLSHLLLSFFLVVPAVVNQPKYAVAEGDKKSPPLRALSEKEERALEIPEHLVDKKMMDVPDLIREFAAATLGATVFFVDDPQCSNSVRSNRSVFINTRGTYWANYIAPPIGASSFAETIVLRLLHELGHIANNHPGDAVFDKSGQLVRSPSDHPFQGRENEAWQYAFNLRDQNREVYDRLVSSVRQWLTKHKFESKDWDDDLESQLERRRKSVK